MPNWCSNYIEVIGDGRDIKDFIEKSYTYTCCYDDEEIEEKIKEYTFNGLHPVPEDVRKAGYANTGYNWQIDNWGTKWDALNEAAPYFNEWLDVHAEKDMNEKFDSELCFSLATAWGPCDIWLLHVSKLYPDLEFFITYDEGGCCLFGKEKIVDGSILEESTYDSETEFRYYTDDTSIEDIVSGYIEWNHDGLEKHMNTYDEFKEAYEDVCREFKWYEDDIREIALIEFNRFFDTDYKF